MNRLLIKNANQMLTMSGSNYGDIGIIKNAWLYAEDGIIKKIGTEKEVSPYIKDMSDTVIDASNKTVLPGFVDCHTHIVFGGSRVYEYIASATGNKDKLEKLGVKTGIYATIDMTKNLSVEQLYEETKSRIFNMILSGTTTLESKSGYCLNTDGELKMLEVNQLLAEKLPLDVFSTFLGAHGWPKLEMSKEDYIQKLTTEMIPAVAKQGIAQFCDIWCDDGYYTAEESKIVLQCGEKYGLAPKIHTDAYSYIGGSDLAGEMKMVSADHLNYTPDSAIKKLVDNNVVGVVLPVIEFAVNHPKPVNIRRLIDSGMMVALATNCNPGCWVESIRYALIFAIRSYGMTPEEALYASTYAGACGLNLKDRGELIAGKKADIQIWDTLCYEDIFYKYGHNPVKTVIKNGKVSVHNGKIF